MNHLSAAFLPFVLATALAAPALGQGLDVAAERTRIESERRMADARLADEEKACRARFAVTDCTNAAQARHREAQGALRRQEITLNEMERKRKAAERQRELDERLSPERAAQAEREREQARKEHAERLERAAAKAAKRAGDEAAKAAAREGRTDAPRSASPSASSSAAKAAARKAEQEQKVAEAREHKAKVLKRNAENRKPPAQPLPVPN